MDDEIDWEYDEMERHPHECLYCGANTHDREDCCDECSDNLWWFAHPHEMDPHEPTTEELAEDFQLMFREEGE